MEKKGTLRQKRRPKGDPNPQKGPLGDPGLLKGTQLGTVLLLPNVNIIKSTFALSTSKLTKISIWIATCLCLGPVRQKKHNAARPYPCLASLSTKFWWSFTAPFKANVHCNPFNSPPTLLLASAQDKGLIGLETYFGFYPQWPFGGKFKT